MQDYNFNFLIFNISFFLIQIQINNNVYQLQEANLKLDPRNF